MFKVQELLLSPDTFENVIFKLHLHCFRFYGYVASTEQQHPRLALVRCTIFTASIWVSCALMLTSVCLASSFERLSDGATSWATAVQYFAVSIATLNAYVQRERVVQMLRVAHADLLELLLEADAVELELVQATRRYVRTITWLLWLPSVVAGLMAWLDCIYRTIFLPQTVFNASKPILLFQLFPFGDLCDNFVIGYLGPWYALGLGITTIPLWHTFITCLMKFVTLKLQILNKRVLEMDIHRRNPALRLRKLTASELSYWRLELCRSFAEEQVRIRQFVEQLQQLIRVPVMADFIIFSILMCFLFFALMMGVPSKMDYSFMFIYVFVMSAILWIYHWHATLIVECQEELAFGLYACDWYSYALPVQRQLLYMLQHAQRPMRMRALLVDMNLRTFLDIVRGAYSYFNLLRSSHLY
ncbi:hypothetical protein KR222_000101 [Zaprionus bogoriensis]|nr:hypothetical protein KR222_000101 [Zaprionus bogoriensis]